MADRMTYAVHTDTCSYLLDEGGVCRWVVSPKGLLLPQNSAVVGAQFVASLDMTTPTGLVGELRVGAHALFARFDERGRHILLRTGVVARVESRDYVDDAPEAEEDAAPPSSARPPRAPRAPARAPEPRRPPASKPRVPSPKPGRAPLSLPQGEVSISSIDVEETITLVRPLYAPNIPRQPPPVPAKPPAIKLPARAAAPPPKAAAKATPRPPPLPSKPPPPLPKAPPPPPPANRPPPIPAPRSIIASMADTTLPPLVSKLPAPPSPPRRPRGDSAARKRR